MTIKPEISVIVPVYNAEAYLLQCVNSILNQSFKNFELLLVNDGSTDRSGIICDELIKKDERIRVFHKNNGGVSSARNIGLDNAQGKWVSFVDSDDWIEPNMLDEVLQEAIKNDAEVVFIDLKYHYPSESKVYKTYRWKDNPQVALLDYLKKTRNVPGWALIKYSIIKNNNYKFPENLTIYEDFHLMVRLVYKSNAIAQVEKPLYNYRMQDYSIVHTTTHNRTLLDQAWAYNSILNYFKDNDVYEFYAPSLYGRILHDYQRMALDSSLHKEFCRIYPEKKHFIWQCTTINLKLKIIMWCITHNMSFVAFIYCYIRKLYKKFRHEV